MNNIEPVFGTYQLPVWRERFLHFSQKMPHSWLGRRAALISRRLALNGWTGPVDGMAEGFRLRVHTSDNVSERKFLFMPQFVDPVERGFIREWLSKKGGLFLDVGANAGIYSLTAAGALEKSGKTGTVVSVEPNPTMLARLKCNLGLNGLDQRVQVYPLALADRPGEVEFTVSDSNLGESSLAGGSGRTIRVVCETLLSLLGQVGAEQVSGLKIDVEGLEDRILMPFLRDASRNLYPKFIIIENSQPIWAEDLAVELENRGYRILQRCRMNSIYVLQDFAP